MKKIQTNKLSNDAKSSLIKRIITGIVLAVICVPCIIFGGYFYFGLVAVITVLAAFEITHITDLKASLKGIISALTIILTLAIVYYVLYHNLYSPLSERIAALRDYPTTGNIFADNLFQIDISIMLLILMVAIYFIICFFNKDFTTKHVFYYVTMVFIVSVGVQSFLTLRYSPFIYFNFEGTSIDVLNSNSFKYGQSTFLLAYVLIGVIMNDIGAYFIGVLFGKHKMNERISPKKTWEGFLGGIVFSLISSIVFAWLVTRAGKPMLPVFDFVNEEPYSLFYIIGISILLPLLADVGDFMFSAIKRYWGVKDFSNILPGHGGILDRIDSLIFAATLVSCLIIFIEFFVHPELIFN